MQTPLYISKLSASYAIFLVLFSIIARGIFDLLIGYLGREGLIALVWGGFLVAGLVVLRPAIRLSKRRLVGIVFVVLAGVLYALTFDRFEERTHLIKYGILGWMLSADFYRSSKIGSQRYLIELPQRLSALPFAATTSALLCVLFVSIVDESVQHFTPGRVGDVRDVLFDMVGGLWGALGYLVAVPKPKQDN